MDPLISVIIPTYNFGHLLGFAVKQKNQGPAQARNEGLSRAKGEYIQFLDADDILQSQKLKEQVKVILQNPKVDIVYSTAFFFKSDIKDPSVRLEEGEEEEDYRPKITGSGKEIVRAFLKNSIIISCSLLKYSAVKEMNFFNKKLIQSEDWDLYLRMAVAGKYFYYISNNAPDSSVLIRLHPNNNTLNFFRLQYYVIKMRMLFASYFKDAELLDYNRKLINNNLEQLVNELTISLKNGKRKLAINQAFKLIGLRMNLRYSIYTLGSLFLPAESFDKLTRFSFKKLFK